MKSRSPDYEEWKHLFCFAAQLKPLFVVSEINVLLNRLIRKIKQGQINIRMKENK